MFPPTSPPISGNDVMMVTFRDNLVTKDSVYKGLLLVSDVFHPNKLHNKQSGVVNIFWTTKSEEEVNPREELLWKLKEEASRIGADAIVDLKMETNQISS